MDFLFCSHRKPFLLCLQVDAKSWKTNEQNCIAMTVNRSLKCVRTAFSLLRCSTMTLGHLEDQVAGTNARGTTGTHHQRLPRVRQLHWPRTGPELWAGHLLFPGVPCRSNFCVLGVVSSTAWSSLSVLRPLSSCSNLNVGTATSYHSGNFPLAHPGRIDPFLVPRPTSSFTSYRWSTLLPKQRHGENNVLSTQMSESTFSLASHLIGTLALCLESGFQIISPQTFEGIPVLSPNTE